MNRVGVPTTWPEARPPLTSRWIRPSTAALPVSVEGRDIQPELGGVPTQVAVVECFLAVEQQLVHVPEPALPGGGLGRSGGGEGVRVDAGQWEMPRAYFDAQPSWHGRKPTQPVPSRRVSSWRWGSTRLLMMHWACYLAAPGWTGQHHLGTTRLIFWPQRISCCAGSVSWVHQPGC
jgi:hypothetical protein